MLPGHTYAAWVSNGVKTADGKKVGRPQNLVSLLASSAPKDKTLAGIYDSYKPFRDYLQAQLIDPTTVLDATVFTVDGIQTP